MSPDEKKKPHPPDDDRERTAQFDPAAEAEEDTEGPVGSERTAQFSPDDSKSDEGTLILDTGEIEADAARGGRSERESTARLSPEEKPGNEVEDREATRREITPLPHLREESAKIPHTPAPGLRLEDSSPEILAPTRNLGPGVDTRKAVAAHQEAVKEKPHHDATTRADAPKESQPGAGVTRPDRGVAATSSGLALANIPADPPAGIASIDVPPPPAPKAPAPKSSAQAQVPGTEAEEPIEDEVDRPYSLQPDEQTSPGESTTGPKEILRLPTPVWVVLGIISGIALFAAWYFKPTIPDFTPPHAQYDKLGAVPNFGNVVPPKEWTRLQDRFYGLDDAHRPWSYDPDSGKTTHAYDKIDDNVAKLFRSDRFTLVGRPPLETHTRLSWINDSAGTGGVQLWCRDFDLSEEPQLTAVTQVFKEPIMLPRGSYRFGPLAVDHPDPAVGMLLVTVEDKGLVTAYRLESSDRASTTTEWSYSLQSKPVLAPITIFNGDTKAPGCAVLFFTQNGMVALNAADGKLSGEQAWGKPLETEGKIAFASIRSVEAKQERAWVISNGQWVRVAAMAQTGALKFVGDEITLKSAAQGSHPVRIVGFPDTERPERDDCLIAMDDGTLVRLAGKVEQSLKVENFSPISIASIDTNGDAWWDFLVVNEIGELLSILDGAALARGEAKETVLHKTNIVASPPVTDVLWRADDKKKKLEGTYFVKDGSPQRLSIDLPAIDQKSLDAIAGDFTRRDMESSIQ